MEHTAHGMTGLRRDARRLAGAAFSACAWAPRIEAAARRRPQWRRHGTGNTGKLLGPLGMAGE
jgi:hypothetical protein